MWYFTEKRIGKSISNLRKWIPGLQSSENDAGILAQFTLDYEALHILQWSFLVIYGKQNNRDTDVVKVYMVKPNYQELCSLIGYEKAERLGFIKTDSFGNSYLYIRPKKWDPYDGAHILSSIISSLKVIERYSKDQLTDTPPKTN